MTKIPWTQETWNPVVGCTKIAAGCKNCYAEQMARRLRAIGYKQYADVIGPYGQWTGRLGYDENALEQPFHWKKPRKIFICSMGDLFHEKVPFEFIQEVFDIIKQCPHHIFQILTKRPLRMAQYITAWEDYPYPPNLWLGTSISTQDDADKNIPILFQIPAAVRFISLEPLLPGRLQLYPCYLPIYEHTGKPCHIEKSGYHRTQQKCLIDWVIIGCESGPKARLCSLDDIDFVIDQCRAAEVPIFLKQIPLNGRCEKDPKKWPSKYQSEDLRQYPKNISIINSK